MAIVTSGTISLTCETLRPTVSLRGTFQPDRSRISPGEQWPGASPVEVGAAFHLVLVHALAHQTDFTNESSHDHHITSPVGIDGAVQG